MKVSIIGSGDVGQALARGLIELGHNVMIGTRDVNKKDLHWVKKHPKEKISVGSYTESADFGEFAILAVAWNASDNVLTVIKPELSGKVVIDVTNPLIFNDDKPPELAVGHNISAGEMVQQTLSDSHVIKTLNIINHKNMVNPKYKQGKPVMFLCGNNSSAKTFVKQILIEIGWEDIQDIGGIKKSRLLEPLCLLWIEYGVVNDTWNHSFSVLNS